MARNEWDVATTWTPTLELFQQENRLIARIDLPGTKKEEVAILVADGRLTVRGERTREADVRTEQLFRSERQYGTFQRTITLPAGVQPETITASMTDGVLEVVVPLPARAPAPTGQATRPGKAAKAA